MRIWSESILNESDESQGLDKYIKRRGADAELDVEVRKKRVCWMCAFPWFLYFTESNQSLHEKLALVTGVDHLW
jgi:hypothetical protein